MVLRLVMEKGLALVGAGTAIGLAMGFAVERLMNAMLFNSGGVDLMAYAVVVPSLFLATMLAVLGGFLATLLLGRLPVRVQLGEPGRERTFRSGQPRFLSLRRVRQPVQEEHLDVRDLPDDDGQAIFQVRFGDPIPQLGCGLHALVDPRAKVRSTCVVHRRYRTSRRVTASRAARLPTSIGADARHVSDRRVRWMIARCSGIGVAAARRSSNHHYRKGRMNAG